MRVLVLAIALVLAGCNSGATPADPDTSATPSEDVVLPRVESEAATFRVVRVMDDLERPWGVAWLPDGRMLITERPGRMVLADGDSVTPLDGLPQIAARGQGGLMDVALHPQYAETGWIYFTYSAADESGAGTVLARAKLDGTRLVDMETLYEQTPFVDSGRHFGSRIIFPGDGTLLFGIGDRGQRDPAQNLSNSIGNVFRLTLDGEIPEDNPFVGQDGALPEIYSYGHRNPQGMIYHPTTGEIWEHEHGPRGGDELNLIEPGKNYGWPEITYGREYSTNAEIGGFEKEGMEQPVTYWDPSIAPSGMAVYTGDQFPGWEDNLFVGALAHEKIQRVVLGTEDGKRVVTHQETLLEEEIGRIRDVRTGPDGNLYVLTDEESGGLYRIEPAEGS